MAEDSPWGRRLIICCDGTWQSSVSSKDNVPSNVTKLCRVIARIGTDQHDPNKKWHQMVYYDSGIGTGNLSGSEARRQGGTGAGLSENVIEAYNFIVLNYEAGDEIFCFGFSRGAYTARAVAGLITDIGVIKPIHMQLFPQIYRAYMTNDEGLPFRETQAWLDFVQGKVAIHGGQLKKVDSDDGEPLTKKDSDESIGAKMKKWEITPHPELVPPESSRQVKVVGVWDTVGSLGVPDVAWFDFSNLRTKYGFHNVKLNEHIEHAYHALALDERRKAFRPTLWYIPHDLPARVAKEGKTAPELKQVWFPGVHINSGGGSDDAICDMEGDLEGLSTVSFAWMLQCVSVHLTIDPNAFFLFREQYLRWLHHIRYACTYHHTTWKDTIKSKLPTIPILNPATDPLAPPRRDPQHDHPDFDLGWGTGPLVDSYSGMYKFAGQFPRVPGHCVTELYDVATAESKLDDINKFGLTHEYIHPICEYRRVVRSSLDAHSALHDFTRKFEETEGQTKGRFWWYRKGDPRPLPEWVILQHGKEGGIDIDGCGKGEVNFERSWYEACEKNLEDKKMLKKGGYVDDFLGMLDKRIDFEVGKKEGWVYP